MSYTNGIGNMPPVSGAATQATTHVTDAAKTNRHNASANDVLTSHADHTDLSSAGAVVAQALQGSDVRADKVAALKEAIDSGNYQVSSSDVAGKMIDSLLR